MTKKPQLKKTKLTDAERHERFVETAKNVGASEHSEDFDKAFARLDIRRPISKKNDHGSSESI